MTLRRVNTDAIGWETPSEFPGQPPNLHSATKGQVVDLPEHFVAAKKDVRILVHYPIPGSQDTVARYEPVLLDPDGDGEIEARAAEQARADALRAELMMVESALNAPPINYSRPVGYAVDDEETIVLDDDGPIVQPTGESLGDVHAAAEAKRRGRPVGSKNAPKVTAEPVVPPVVDAAEYASGGIVLGAPDGGVLLAPADA